MLGFVDTGKTSIMYEMNIGEIISQAPTIGFYIETLKTRNLSIFCWDIYPNRIRLLWNHFFK
jgi:ADP-ribosylation factor-like protein 1